MTQEQLFWAGVKRSKVISASRRTDIPAFYTEWLLNRLEAGFCHWINPFGGQVRKVSLKPQDCLALIFWTRQPAPLLPYLEELKSSGYRYYFHFTVNSYGLPLESCNPPVDAAIRSFRRAAEIAGSRFVLWRYDPIVISDRTPPAWHLQNFARIARELAGYTERCYFSFVDFYGKTKKNFELLAGAEGINAFDPSPTKKRELVQRMLDIAEPLGISLHSCCEPELLSSEVTQAHCADRELIAELIGESALKLLKHQTRKGCGCYESTDIGAYDTCLFGCRYCYATRSREIALPNHQRHNPKDSLLLRPPGLVDSEQE